MGVGLETGLVDALLGAGAEVTSVSGTLEEGLP